MERRDHGRPRRPDGVHQGARHAGELEQAGGVEIEEMRDDVADIAAATEAPRPLSAEHHAARFGELRLQPAERVAELGVHLEGERVDAVRSVERQREDAVLVEVAAKCAGLDRHRDSPSILDATGWTSRGGITAVASISTRAPSSRRSATSTSDIAG